MHALVALDTGFPGVPDAEELAVILFIAILLLGAHHLPNLFSNLLSIFRGGNGSRNSAGTQPDTLQDLSPKEFEERTADLFETRGYSTIVTRQSGEDGVDVIARGEKEVVAVEAKRYKPGNKVGPKTIERTHRGAEKVRADRAAVVTTSSFTTPARERATKLGVELTTGEQVVHELNQEAA